MGDITLFWYAMRLLKASMNKKTRLHRHQKDQISPSIYNGILWTHILLFSLAIKITGEVIRFVKYGQGRHGSDTTYYESVEYEVIKFMMLVTQMLIMVPFFMALCKFSRVQNPNHSSKKRAYIIHITLMLLLIATKIIRTMQLIGYLKIKNKVDHDESVNESNNNATSTIKGSGMIIYDENAYYWLLILHLFEHLIVMANFVLILTYIFIIRGKIKQNILNQ